jgi:transcription-repair coupling factor (superfamily II helicase)
MHGEECSVPRAAALVLDRLTDLPVLLQSAEGFEPLLAALRQGRSGVIDGAWGSSAGLAAAALAPHAPQTLLVVIAHPRDLDAWAGDLLTFSGVRPAMFPARDDQPSAGRAVDAIASQRLRLLKQLDSGDAPRLLLTTIQALLQPVPDRMEFAARRRVLRRGDTADLEELAAWLVDHGYQNVDAVELPGEFSRRGGILDVHSPDAEAPHRLEFFGDEIDSIRQFSPATQRSLGDLQRAEWAAIGMRHAEVGMPKERGHLGDYLPEDAWVVLAEAADLTEQGRQYLDRIPDPQSLFSMPDAFARLLRFPSVTVSALPSPSVEATLRLRVESVERFSGDVTRVRDELDAVAARERVMIACHNDAECKRLGEVLASGRLAQSERLRLVVGRVRAGFRLVDPVGVVVLGGQELFHRDAPPGPGLPTAPRRRLESRAIDSFLDLAEGDLVVHLSHGIARYRGMEVLEKNAAGPPTLPSARGGVGSNGSAARQKEEHLVLEFRDGVRLYVPASKIDLVQKYVGGGKTEPELSKLGGVSWQHRKDRVQAAVLDLASDMIQLQAVRESQPGFAFPPDSDWQAEFEASFPYRETPDQLTSMAEIKADMQKARSADRLICGDVGYGKTELAVRAAFKAVDNGKQVAVLAPTTVLAEQHQRTFGQRLAEFPFTVECISRFRSGAEQKRILGRLAKGGVDVIVGTHRLLSADVHFKDLGLVIIDEEQRFGVEHKECLKRLRLDVDVLTMTATPIPRTLHLSLLGIRDISNLETPPPDRLAIETRIVRFDSQLIRNAILRELNREGQVYFVHNRVHNIQDMADGLKKIVPEARLAVGHGQMHGDELEEAMLRFVRREADVLVATTIIESGLDIPNANTIFINQADNYGLADLHQLRGRVGRYKHRAYAYLLLDGDRQVSPTATRRLKAIEEFTELGAGFKIAMRDLEIRGAGNILGNQQSGHIAAVGYELYCQLLENAVRGLKGQARRTPLEVTVDLPWTAYFPRDYVAGQRQRIEAYRRLARVRGLDRLEDFIKELRDRYGPPPAPAEWLLRLAELRLLAAHWRIGTVHLEKAAEEGAPTDVVLGYRNTKRIKELAERSRGRLVVVDEKSAYFRLRPAEMEPMALYKAVKGLLRV